MGRQRAGEGAKKRTVERVQFVLRSLDTLNRRRYGQ